MALSMNDFSGSVVVRVFTHDFAYFTQIHMR